MSKLYKGGAKGELVQLRNSLDSNDESVRKAAAKRVLALMRAGENLSCLFSSMFRCVKTNDLELKKLAYHYIITYAPFEPEQSIMAVNSFIQDSQDYNPLIRALAVRTMCRIKVDTVAEYMVQPLKQSLQDKDPYVRKTAALAVAKLYEIIPESVENAQMFPILNKMLFDENPMVISNTIASIFEINEHRTQPIFELTEKTVIPIISAISSCSEWVLTILLDSLAKYKPATAEEADQLIDRLIPFLKHGNPAVVVASFRCIFDFLPTSKKSEKEIFPLILPPFITLVSQGEPEIQFAVLRTISLFVHKYPKALSKEIRVFFCKYNDPSYVKMEKLTIINQLCSTKTITLVLSELDEYCNAVDISFVRKSIKTLGQVAIRIEASARKVVDILVRLIESKIDYAVEESIIVMTDILRHFPGEFEGVIATVCNNMDTIKDSRAKAALIWIIGEYCSKIEHVDAILDPFIDTFHDEDQEVQIQLLTALVKVYLYNEELNKDQLQLILSESVKESCLPDVRNRGLIYWRLLSADVNAARNTIVFQKEPVTYSGEKFSPEVLQELIRNMGNVSGVLHVVASDFVKRVRYMPDEDDEFGDSELISKETINSNDPAIAYEQVNDLLDPSLAIFISFNNTKVFLKAINKHTQPFSNFALALNKNAFGITLDLSKPIDFPQELQFGETFEVSIPILIQPDQIANQENVKLQFALRTNEGVKMFVSNIYLPSTIQKESDPIIKTSDEFNNLWTSQFTVQSPIQIEGTLADEETLKQRNLTIIPNTDNNSITKAYCKINNMYFLSKVRQNSNNVEILLRSSSPIPQIISSNISSLFCV